MYERYKRPGPKKQYQESAERKKNKKWYQSTEWKHFRKKVWAVLVGKDQKFIMKFYASGKSWIIPWYYTQFINSKSPYCRHCYENKILRSAHVLDHIKPIKDGGKKTDKKNVQPLCHSCHNRKSATEK